MSSSASGSCPACSLQPEGEGVPQLKRSGRFPPRVPGAASCRRNCAACSSPLNGVWPGYFTTVRHPVLKGRGFTEADREGAGLVAIVNETTARMFWPGEDPVGKRFKHRLNPNFYTVVGVARDAKYQPVWIGDAAARSSDYAALQCLHAGHDPRDPHVWRSATRAARRAPGDSPTGRDDASADAAHHARGAQRESVDRPAGGDCLLAVFGLLAVTLTTVGIYGVMAYSVSRRTQEIGIRMALGAAHADVMRMVLRQGVKLTLLGVAIGLAAALGATRLIANLLFVSPTDGRTFAAVSMLLAAVAMAASFLPARRAARVDPLVALRRDC